MEIKIIYFFYMKIKLLIYKFWNDINKYSVY